MKRFFVFLLIILFPTCLMAQQYAEYNRKGDEAMKKKDYYDARFWYGEGVEYCDIYSIKRLATIWLENERMRPSMRNIMGRCLTCLNTNAANDDLVAISQLITFYREGIGTPKNEQMATLWESKKIELEAPRIDPVTPREPMKFFTGYAFSTEMPFGVTVGGVQNNIGWYIRFKTNFSFANYDKECELSEDKENTVVHEAEDGKTYQVNKDKSNKKNSFAGTVGFIYQTTSWLNLSVGAGYGERTLITPFNVINNQSMLEEEIDCKNLTGSYKGVVIEADATFRHKNLFFSIGCHSMNFEYVDINAGIGVFF